MIFVFLFLTYFPLYGLISISKSIHISCKWHNFVPFYGWVPDSSVDKESTCNAGVPNLIPGLGRSTGEGISYPLQYSWASLVAQLVKNLPAVQETWVRSLGWEDSLEKRKATHSRILAWRIPWAAWGCKGSNMTEWLSLSLSISHCLYVPHLLCPFLCQRTSGMLPCPGCYK